MYAVSGTASFSPPAGAPEVVREVLKPSGLTIGTTRLRLCSTIRLVRGVPAL
jgi:hypothetical protein